MVGIVTRIGISSVVVGFMRAVVVTRTLREFRSPARPLTASHCGGYSKACRDTEHRLEEAPARLIYICVVWLETGNVPFSFFGHRTTRQCH